MGWGVAGSFCSSFESLGWDAAEGEPSGARLSQGVDAAAGHSGKDRVDQSKVSTARPLPRPAVAPASFLPPT